MTTEARTHARIAKQLTRKLYNTGRKIIAAGLRHAALVEAGKTVVVTEKDGVKSYDFAPAPISFEPPTPPRLSWVGAKQYIQQGDSRKLRSGFGTEHAEAIPENASRVLAKEIDKALMPDVPIVEPATVPAPDVAEVTSIPLTTTAPEGVELVQAHIGQFADRDPIQGAAIDHSIATGEPLFS